MTSVRISNLPAANSLNGTELVPVVKDGATQKATISQFTTASLDNFIADGAGAVVRSAQAKMRDAVSVKDFGAVGDNVTNDTAAIQAAIDSLSVNGGTLYFPPGTYIISNTIRLRPNVTLYSYLNTATLKQAANANLTIMLDFANNSANNSRVIGLVIDGNLANNSNNVSVARHCFWLYDTNNVTIDGCEIKDFNGTAITGRNCLTPRITNNYIHDCLGYGIGIARSAFGNNRPLIANNRFEAVSWHSIGLINCWRSKIINNYFETFRVTGQTVTVSGNTANWVSGPDFTGVRPGHFLIYDNGREALIVSVNSSTQLTLQGSPVSATSVAAACGAADIVNVQASANTLIKGNHISGGAAGGIVIWADTGQTTQATSILGNQIESIGGAAINIHQYGTGAYVLETLISENIITDAGLNAAAIPSNYRNATNIEGAGVGTISVIGNIMRAYSATMDGLNVITPGVVVRAAHNLFQGMASNIVNGAAIVLTGWGAGTTVSNLLVTEDTISFLITTSTTASGADPTFEITHRVMPVRSKVPSCQMTASSGTILPVITSYPDPASASLFIVKGTPTVSTTYRFVVRL